MPLTKQGKVKTQPFYSWGATRKDDDGKKGDRDVKKKSEL